MSRPHLFLTLGLLMLLVACGRGMPLSATFAAPTGLEAGAPVYLADAQVGEVTRLTNAGNVTEADISVDPDLRGALRKGSAALLAHRNGRTVIELYNYRAGDEALEDGGELVGLNGPLELAAWQAGEALEAGRRSMNAISGTITDYFESEAWQQHKERMNRQMEDLEGELGRTYEEMDESYRALIKDLESRSEAARERAKETYVELARRLREEITRLEKEGRERLVEPLRRLLEDLSRAMEKQPEQEST